MTCTICGIRPAVNPGATCGNSHCQEAAYYVNRARNTRGRGKPEAERQAGLMVATAAGREDGGVR